jgi:hypothetical protein
MKPNMNYEQDFTDEKCSMIDYLNDSSTRSTSDISAIERKENNFLKLTSRSLSYIFPLIYFFSSSLFLFIILFINLFKEKETKHNFESLPMNPFPSLFTLKEVQPKIFSASIFIISISGFLNVWFFCSLLLQRFSVPELKSNKLTVHLMFILGIFGNIIYIFFGFSPEILHLESQKIKILNISLSMIIFLSFVFFNTLFASLTLMVFQKFRSKIAINDKRLRRNIKVKKYVVYLTIFLCIIFITCLFLKYLVNEAEIGTNKKLFVKSLQTFIFILPYFLFLFNAVINLTYYLDIRYLDDIINVIIDREFFLTSDDSSMLLSDFPI